MMKSNNIKIPLIIAFLSVFVVASFSAFYTMDKPVPEDLAVGGGPGTINQISPFIVTGGYVKVASSTAGLQVPSLANCDTIDTDGDGKFECGVDGGGAGGSATTTINGVTGPDFTFATGTATGIGLTISTSTGTLTFTPTVSSGYNIPLTASTTEWANKISSQWITSGSNIYYNTGNVGIGTSSPENIDGWARVLDVYGAVNSKSIVTTSAIRGGMYAHNLGYFSAPAGMIMGANSNHPVSFITNGATRMTINTSGNVGIGTASPSASAKLHIDGSNALIYTEPSADDGQWNGLNTLNSSGIVIGGFAANTQSGEVAVGSRNSSYFTTIYGGNTERMRITSTGNVGIGTTAPGAKLHVVAETRYNFGNEYAIVAADTSNPNQRVSLGYDDALSAGVLQAATEGSSWDTLLLNPNGGNVGIGTTTPGYKLTIAGDTNQTGALRFGGNAGTTGQILLSNGSSAPTWTATSSLGLAAGFFAQDGNSFGTTATLGTNDSQNLAFETNGATRMTIASTTGNVGIGTASPSAKLTVVAGADTDIIDFRESGGAFGRIGAISAADLQSRIYVGYGSGTEHLVIRYNGNVGIGTTTPGSLLTVAGTTNVTGATTLSSTLNVTGQTTLANATTTNLTVSTNSYLGTVRSGTWNGSTIGETYGGTGQTTYATGDLLYASGANTLAKRTIGSTGDILLVSGGVPTWTATSSLGLGTTFFEQGGNSFGTTATLGTNDANSLAFETSGTTRVTIDASGNVGVGTTTPATKLDIVGTSGSNNIFTISSSTNSRLLTLNALGYLGIGSSTPSAHLVVDDGVNATSTVQIGGPGSVGCLAIRDTDDAGYTYVTALNGVLSASMTSCE